MMPLSIKLMATFGMAAAAFIVAATMKDRTIVVERFCKQGAFVCVTGAAISLMVLVWTGL